MKMNSTSALNSTALTPMSDAHFYGTGAIAELETRLRNFYGVRHALCVSNATVGLLAIGKALGLSRDEFVTTPYTYGASVAGLLWLDNRPVFADVESDTLALDPKA